MEILFFLYKAVRKIWTMTRDFFDQKAMVFHLKMNGVEYSNDFVSKGRAVFRISKGGRMKIGADFRMNNGKYHNIIGRQQPCYFVVGSTGTLEIAENVAMSATAIVCMQKIIIEKSVKIGGNCVIYDTDFHSLDHTIRNAKNEDLTERKTATVTIRQNAFIGAHCLILKGTEIGENSIIGAGSVVTKSIPANQIWGGNPAKFIKDIN